MSPSRTRTDRTAELPNPGGEPKAPDLTVNKILAGAAAAATSAVAGSLFGASGTVTGAALGSVILTVGSTIYQRSLDRTRDTVKAKIQVIGRNDSTVVVERPVQGAVPAPRTSPEEPETVLLGPVTPVGARPRRWLVGAGATVLVFVLGLLIVTGMEWVKGSTLTGGEAGTSVGRVVAPPPPAPVEDGSAVVPPDDGPPQERSTPTPEPEAPATGTSSTREPAPTTGPAETSDGGAPGGTDGTDGSGSTDRSDGAQYDGSDPLDGALPGG